MVKLDEFVGSAAFYATSARMDKLKTPSSNKNTPLPSNLLIVVRSKVFSDPEHTPGGLRTTWLKPTTTLNPNFDGLVLHQYLAVVNDVYGKNMRRGT